MNGRLYEKCAEIEKMQIKRQNKHIAGMKKLAEIAGETNENFGKEHKI